MLEQLSPFLVHWAITALSLWVASHIFRGVKFDSTGALVVSALLLGFANAIVKPLLIVLTLPLTLLTFGLFLLVINALVILLVAALVKGFRISGFWTAVFASLFVSVLSLVIGAFVGGSDPAQQIQMPQLQNGTGNWL
ncbi:phage holin family protein [Pseudorhodoferax sp.]|uniref:phage holin family protein n=1 Tax=Pseudorhodoferax sp. TaxID=1993553 RepID=UPI002DD68671|nr:phage holin family protein [Pseudorhodoferax sp.]